MDLNKIYPIFFSSSMMIAFCFGVSAAQWSSISRSSGVRTIGSSPSRKKVERDMPRPMQILFKLSIVGV